MRKKTLLLLLLVPALLLLITGCGKKENKTVEPKDSNTKTIDLFDEKMGIKTTFTYNLDDNFTDFEKNDGGASKSMTFKNEDLDVEFEMYYNSITKESYDTAKSNRSSQKYYKEYKFGDYEAYAYGEYGSGLYLNILANIDDFENVNVLFVSIDRIDTNQDIIVSDVVADKVIQDFFNSMKVEMSN